MSISKRTLGAILAAALLSTSVVACADSPEDGEVVSSTGENTEAMTPDMMAAIEGKTWNPVSYNQTPVLPDTEITLELADGRLNGSAGCNSYFADYQLENSQLIVERVGSTKMTCGEPGVMEQETAYLNLLQQATNNVAVTENAMTVETPEGSLVFESAG